MIFNIIFSISMIFMLIIILPHSFIEAMIFGLAIYIIFLDTEETINIHHAVKSLYNKLKYDLSWIDIFFIYPFTFVYIELNGRYSLPYGCFPVYHDYCAFTARHCGWLMQLLVITIILVLDLFDKLNTFSRKVDVLQINLYYVSMMISCVNMMLHVQSMNEYMNWGKRTQPLMWELCILWYIILKSYMCINYYFPPSLTVTQHVENDDAECLESEVITISNPVPVIVIEN